MSVREGVVSILDFGAKVDGYSDDSESINSAFIAIAANGGGTVIFPAGLIRISETIVIPESGIRIQAGSSYLTRIKPLESFTGKSIFYYQNNREGNKGLNIDDGLFIDCAGVKAHGIYVENGYDQFSMKNVEVRNLHPEFSGFKFVYVQSKVGVGQTILLENCFAEHGTHLGDAPAFSFTNYQEINLIGCKGFGNRANTEELINPNLNSTCFSFIDCRGVTMTGCSSAFSKTGIEFIAYTRSAIGLTVIGQTNEKIFGNALFTDASIERTKVSHVTYHANRAQNGGGAFHLNRLELSTIYALNEQVNLSESCFTNTIYSSAIGKVSGRKRNNTIITMSNYGNDATTFHGTLEIESEENTNFILKNASQPPLRFSYKSSGDISFQKQDAETLIWKDYFKIVPSFANDYTGLMIPYRTAGINKFAQIKVDKQDSGGLGYRNLIIPN